MQIVFHNDFESQERLANVIGRRVTIGRARSNDIILDSPYVAPEAAVLEQEAGRWQLTVLGRNGCEVGERQVRAGDRITVDSRDPIRIFPFTLSLSGQSGLPHRDTTAAALDDSVSEFVSAVHCELLSRMDLDGVEASLRQDDESLLSLERLLDEIARVQGIAEESSGLLQAHLAGYALRGELIHNTVVRDRKAKNHVRATRDAAWMRMASAHPVREQDVNRLLIEFIGSLELSRTGDLSETMSRIDEGYWKEWERVNAMLLPEMRLYLALRELKKQIKDIVFGYGPLEDLLRAPHITEILVVRSDRIYIEKDGIIENSGRRFVSDRVTETVIDRIVAQVGRRIDRSQPLVDARLSDGSRVNAIIPPLAVSGPCLTIRKFPEERLTVDDLIAFGSLTPTLTRFLTAAVTARCNILIAGGTGTGKTTLLNCLADAIPNKERIVTIEDTAELQIPKQHVVRLETKQANAEGAGAYTIRDLVKNALRMRPDRIVVGECRGAEALDMLQAMNTGHDGSMTTIHANNPRNVIERLEVLVQFAADLPISSIHRQVASAIDLVVQLTRLKDGRRCVTHVTELVDVESTGTGIRTRELFAMNPHDLNSEIAATGRLPTFMPELLATGLVDLDAFFA
ncbi:MAG: Flp pilus assembly complex ATPase component TadA [Planctomycetaceae bacterium]|nr:Flp pilus assembly complex ATPase component TadA [Planctomycetaceae bacterium]